MEKAEIIGGEIAITENTVHYIEDTAADITFTIGAHATLTLVVFSRNAGKSSIRCILQGEGSRVELHNIYLINGTGSAEGTRPAYELDMQAVHANRNTYSRLTANGIVINGRSLIKGLIKINENAEDSDGYEKSNALIIKDGTAVSVPNLKIHNNNVKCSHGSTVTRLDEEKLFYLQSRGLSRKDASTIAIKGFYAQALNAVSDEKIRTAIAGIIDKEIEVLT